MLTNAFAVTAAGATVVTNPVHIRATVRVLSCHLAVL